MKKILLVIIPLLFFSCKIGRTHDILVGGYDSYGYYIHGDTLETCRAPRSCDSFLITNPPYFSDKDSMLMIYPFLDCKDSIYTKWDETYQAHRYNIGQSIILTTERPVGSFLVYADITDPRIKTQKGIHVGMEVAEVMKRIGLPEITNEIHHIIISDGLDKKYRFEFNDKSLSRIVIQTTNENDLLWNPAPLFFFVEPELSRSDHGPKIFVHNKDSLNFLDPVCYLNAEGDTIVPFSREYAYVGWNEIGRMGLVFCQNKGFCAINHKGEELFQVYGLVDFSPDFIREGMFRIVEGDDKKIGYADTLGNIIIKPQYAYGNPFKYGRAKVTMSGHWDTTNPEMPEWKSDDWFFIDKSGQRIDYVDDSSK